jgi:hypothetical protein
VPDQFYGGPSGAVSTVPSIGGSPAYRSFDKWKLSMKTTLVEVTSFTSNGFQVLVPAITEATLTVTGPYNEGNMPFTTGVSYTWNLYFSQATNVLINLQAYIETIEPDVDVKGRASVNITAKSSGSFTPAVA